MCACAPGTVPSRDHQKEHSHSGLEGGALVEDGLGTGDAGENGEESGSGEHCDRECGF